MSMPDAGGAVSIVAASVSGTMVTVEADDFLRLLQRVERPIVVHSYHKGSFLMPENHQYMFGCQGIVFCVNSKTALDLPEGVDMVESTY